MLTAGKKTKNGDFTAQKDISKSKINSFRLILVLDLTNISVLNQKDKKINDEEDTDDMEGYCKFHAHNQVHILCLKCDEIICDKCELEDHKGHKTFQFAIEQNNDYMINIFQNFYNKMNSAKEEKLINFKEKITEIDNIITNFFCDELSRVEKATHDLVFLLNSLHTKIKKLISMYQKKFKEELNSINDDYEQFADEVNQREYIYIF